MTDDRALTVRWAALSLWLNVALMTVKGLVGWIAHSDALMADAAHSAADVAGSIAVAIGVRVARQPADREHPYGHGKAELVASSLVAITLILGGAGVVYSSLRALALPSAPEAPALAVAVASLVVKEAMYRLQLRVGKKNHSPALVAGAADHRSDVWTSLAAAAGIAVALTGSVFRAPMLRLADPLAGLAVAGLVVRIGYRLAFQSFRSLLDEVADPVATAELRSAAESVPGVLALDDLRARSSGAYWIVDVKISVDPEISVRAGHRIAAEVKGRILGQFDLVRDVLVHVNPYLEEDD